MDQTITPAVPPIAEGVTRTPVPAWVDLAPFTIPEKPNPHFVAGGVCPLLDDTQVDLCGPARAWFSRRADLVTAGVGAERVARFEALYDPSHERVEIHYIHVIRRGEIIDHTQSANFEVLRRERNLEQLKFDGRLSVHLTIPDVRVGDVVEIAHTTFGMRPLLGEKHAAWIGFEWRDPIIEVRHRLRHPETRAVDIRVVNSAPEPVVTHADGIIDKRWREYERHALKGEAMAPPWVPQRAELQFSEWRNWAEVSGLFAPVYLEDAPLPAEVEAEAARIATIENEAERGAAILNFVQHSIRYLAMAIGDGGFVPRPLAEIWATRYGDCKDKAKLFVAMAKRVGLEACPALVNTREGTALDQWLPSAQAFDHCIVRLKAGGKIYWLDPTCLPQPSTLDRVAQSHYGYALPLTHGVDALERMADEPHQHTLECVEWITLGESPEAPVRYEWRVTMRGWRAEETRARFAREGAVGLFKMYTEDLQRSWPKAVPQRQDISRDDERANELVTIEVFDIGDAWQKQPDGRYAFDTLDLYLRSILPKVDQGARKHDIYLGHIGRLTRRVEIESKAPRTVTPWMKRVDASTLSFSTELRQSSPYRLELIQELDIRAWTLPAAEVQAYRDVVAQLELSDLRLDNVVSGGKFVGDLKEAKGGGVWEVLGWLFVAAVGFTAAALFGGM